MIRDIYKDDQDIERSLITALYDLMLTENIDRISVNQITEYAHVSRASFYRRYKDKYDLLNRTYEDILKKTLFRFKENLSWKESVKQIYAVIQENHVFFNNALHSEDVNGFRNYLYEQAFKLESDVLRSNGVDPDDLHNRYRLVAYASAGVSLTAEWCANKADLSLEEMVDLLVEIVPAEFRSYFR